MTKTILLTGASSGLGRATTSALAGAGYRVVATVRTERDADLLAQGAGDIHPVLCDVRNRDQVAALPHHVRNVSDSPWLDGLVNNAAVEFIAPAELQPMEEIRELFETNVLGLFDVTRTLLPLLGTAPGAGGHRGRIVNVSSVGGVLALPLLSAYAATKHAVEGYSHSLRRELRMLEIPVSIFGPGAIKSAIWDKHLVGLPRYDGTPYEPAMARIQKLMRDSERRAISAEDAAEKLVEIIGEKNPKPRYVYTRGRLQNWTIPTLVPHKWVDRMMGNMLGLNPDK